MYSYKKIAHGGVLWYPAWPFVEVHSHREEKQHS